MQHTELEQRDPIISCETSKPYTQISKKAYLTFDRMKRSLAGSRCSLCTLGSLYFITLKKSTLITSAMELQEVGWPDLLAAVILMLWIRSLVERSLSTLASSMVGWW